MRAAQLNHDVCAVGRCRAPVDMTAWSVPICQSHWNQCCAETPDSSSHAWLQRKARREFVGEMPDGPPVLVRKPVRISAPPPAPRPLPRRIVRKPVRITKP